MGNCQLCPRIVLAQAITFADGNLIINLPAGSYCDGQEYCLVTARALPAEATIFAPVYVTIGEGTQLYPLVRCNCSQATASNIRTRTKYPVRVATDATGGSFRLLRRIHCGPSNDRVALDGSAPAEPAPAPGPAAAAKK